MNTFIVGSTGFLGYFAVRELLARGHLMRSMSLHHIAGRNSASKKEIWKWLWKTR
jgi:thioester reductase-like protein